MEREHCLVIMQACFGKKYVMYREENFAEYMTYIGLKKVSQNFLSGLEVVFSLNQASDGSYIINASSQFGDFVYTFVPGEEFDDMDIDLRKGRSVITVDANIFTMIQRSGNGKVSKTVMEYYPDKMITTTTALGFKKTVKRYYKVVQD